MKRRLVMITLFAAIVTLLACNKVSVQVPATNVNVKFKESEDFASMEFTTGNWMAAQGIADLQATGYLFQEFRLHLTNVDHIGTYSVITITNIYYADGLDFKPFTLVDGYIAITSLNPNSLYGVFNILLEDEYHGHEIREIVGNFCIGTN